VNCTTFFGGFLLCNTQSPQIVIRWNAAIRIKTAIIFEFENVFWDDCDSFLFFSFPFLSLHRDCHCHHIKFMLRHFCFPDLCFWDHFGQCEFLQLD
jgi:hypothetical protein